MCYFVTRKVVKLGIELRRSKAAVISDIDLALSGFLFETCAYGQGSDIMNSEGFAVNNGQVIQSDCRDPAGRYMKIPLFLLIIDLNCEAVRLICTISMIRLKTA